MERLNMLTLICGLPNAGKTTYSKQYNCVLHQDEIGAVSKIIKMIEHKNYVVIEGYFGNRTERNRVREAHNGYTKCIYLDISVEESIEREDRNRNPQILRNAARFFEPPSLDEGWDEIIIIRGDNEQRINR